MIRILNETFDVFPLQYSYKMTSFLLSSFLSILLIFEFVYSRGILFQRILTYKREPVVPLSQLFQRNLRMFRYQKTTLKSISFGLEKGLAVYLLRVLMDLLFQPSVLPQVKKCRNLRCNFERLGTGFLTFQYHVIDYLTLVQNLHPLLVTYLQAQAATRTGLV